MVMTTYGNVDRDTFSITTEKSYSNLELINVRIP